MLDISRIRKDFPILSTNMRGKPLVYLDNAATAQKPRVVIDRMSQFYQKEYGTVHRGVYELSQRATQWCDEVRELIQRFLGASRPEEIIFVRGGTEAINLVAASFGSQNLKTGDEILISEIEHHANIVPWQQIARKTGAILRVVPVNDSGELNQDAYEKLLSEKTVLVALTHVSNALGTIVPVKEMIQKAHRVGAKVLVDGAQAAPHMRVNVTEMDCDFYCFSGHKIYGPTGIGVLYGKYALLENMPPYQTGGDMIEQVGFEETTFQKPPFKFEAGTPAIAEIIGLGQAILYLEQIGMDLIAAWEAELLMQATEKIRELRGIRIFGTASKKASLISFNMGHIHAHDIGTVLDNEGIAIRVGHHCAQPVMRRFGVPATARASFAFYNTREEIELFVRALQKAAKLLG